MIQHINTNLSIQKINPDNKEQAMHLRLVGELSGDGIFLLKRAIEPIFMSPTPPLLKLNMADVTYMDSSGVGILISIIRKIRQCGGKLELHGLSDIGCELFKILKLASLSDTVSITGA